MNFHWFLSKRNKDQRAVKFVEFCIRCIVIVVFVFLFEGAPCRSMLFSAFSHYSLFHLFANMYVLWSFAPVVAHILGLEQFVATYLSAGELFCVFFAR